MARRRALTTGGVAALCALLAVPLVLTMTRDDGRPGDVQTVAQETTVTTEGRGSGTTLPASPELGGEDHGSDPSTATSEQVKSATSDSGARACRNSRDPRCGAFRWERPPLSNGELAITVRLSPREPRVGEAVTFTITATDDAQIDRDCLAADLGDGISPSSTCPARDCHASGEWTRPTRRKDRFETTVAHTYSKAGSYEAKFGLRSGACPSPYGSFGSAVVKVTVAER